MYGCGEQEVGVASGSGWNLWVWLLGVVVKRYIDFLILLISTPLVSVLFYSSIPILYTLVPSLRPSRPNKQPISDLVNPTSSLQYIRPSQPNKQSTVYQT